MMETSKKRSCYNQIVAAIQHYENGALDCATTLGAAAEGMINSNDERYMFAQLRQRAEFDMDLNMVINWLKHDGGPEEVVITEFEAAFSICRAITKFIAAHHQSTERMEGFLNHVYETGIIPVKIN